MSEMVRYYTVKLAGAATLPATERMRLEIAYVAQLEDEVGGAEALMNLCKGAAAEGEAGTIRGRLAAAGAKAELAMVRSGVTWPAGARFTLSLWAVENL